MSFIRSQKLDQRPDTSQTRSLFGTENQRSDQWTFGGMIKELFTRVTRQFAGAKTSHFIFDSYIDYSLKGGERISRTGKSKGVINLAKILSAIKVPEQMDKFWSSEKNKIMIQSFARDKIIELAKALNVNVVMSETVSDNDYISFKTPACFYNAANGSPISVPELTSALVEADICALSHM